MFLKWTLKSVPRALHDFVASLDSRAYFTMAVFREFVFCACVYNAKSSLSSNKKERKKERKRKKKGHDQLGLNTLNIFLLVSLFKTSRKRERKRRRRSVRRRRPRMTSENLSVCTRYQTLLLHLKSLQSYEYLLIRSKKREEEPLNDDGEEINLSLIHIWRCRRRG